MDDPTNVLLNSIMAADEEESKRQDEAAPQIDVARLNTGDEGASGDKPSFMSLAAGAEESKDSQMLDNDQKKKDKSDDLLSELVDSKMLLFKHKSFTPMPTKRPHARSNVGAGNGHVNGKPFILGICGGPSSGMITVASKVKRELQKSNISANIVSLVNFYQPIRGNLRKKRSRAGSLVEEEKKEEVLSEIQAINEAVDFDDP